MSTPPSPLPVAVSKPSTGGAKAILLYGSIQSASPIWGAWRSHRFPAVAITKLPAVRCPLVASLVAAVPWRAGAFHAGARPLIAATAVRRGEA